MKCVYIYQIIDQISEGVIASFIGPNDIYARRQFKNFLSDPKLVNNIDPSDFIIVHSDPVKIFESFDDFENCPLNDSFVGAGDSILASSVKDLKEDLDEA